MPNDCIIGTGMSRTRISQDGDRRRYRAASSQVSNGETTGDAAGEADTPELAGMTGLSCSASGFWPSRSAGDAGASVVGWGDMAENYDWGSNCLVGRLAKLSFQPLVPGLKKTVTLSAPSNTNLPRDGASPLK